MVRETMTGLNDYQESVNASQGGSNYSSENRKKGNKKPVDTRSRDQIVYDAHERSYNTSRDDLLYKDRMNDLTLDLTASLERRKKDIESAHKNMMANPNPKRGWESSKTRLKDLKRYWS